MNLHSYFTQQREQRLSDERKFLLYQRICEQKAGATSPSLKRASLLTKNRVYAFLTVMIVFVFFGSFFWDLPKVLEYRAFFVQKDPSGINTVSAGHIAEILEFNGDYLIEKEGKTFQNSVLFDGDLITLKANAKIIFNINDHLKTEVQGPAKFTISQIAEEKYRLYLMEGNFLKVEGQEDTDALQVETEEMTIETIKDEKVALELSKKDQKTELKNSGATLLVKSKKSSLETAPTKLESSKMLTMQDNDITNISDGEKLGAVLTNRKNLTHTTNLTSLQSGETALSNKLTIEEIAQLTSGDISFLASTTQAALASGQQEEIASAFAYQADQKKVPTEKQLSQITAALNAGFLLSDMEAIYQAKLDADSEALASAYRNLGWRLKSLGDTLEVEIDVNGASASKLLSQLEKLQRGFQNYHFPTSKVQQLDILKNWLKHFESFSPREDWESYKTSLPANLKFK